MELKADLQLAVGRRPLGAPRAALFSRFLPQPRSIQPVDFPQRV
jgi:hypothetical protein